MVQVVEGVADSGLLYRIVCRRTKMQYLILGGIVVILFLLGVHAYGDRASSQRSGVSDLLKYTDEKKEVLGRHLTSNNKPVRKVKDVERKSSTNDGIEAGLHLPISIDLNLDDSSTQRVAPVGVNKKALDDYWSIQNQLIPGLVPSIVHFTWCGLRWFGFKQYLSILSIIRLMNPNKIVIHYEQLPKMDKFYYHQWMHDLKHDFPFLYLEEMDDFLLPICREATHKMRVSRILEILRNEGGMYIGENTWMLKFSPHDRMIDLDYSLEADSKDGYIVLRRGVLRNQTYEDILRNGSFRTRNTKCATVSQFYNGQSHPHCLIVRGKGYDSFTPLQITELDDPFGRLSRKIYYGTEEILLPRPSFDELVPNIGHMIWVGGGRMDYVFYLAVLSMLYVAEVETVYIHGDVEPAGPYWQEIKERQPRVKFITRPQPFKIYQGIIEPYYRALMSDIIRVDLMIKYGGIYTDTDAIWVKKLKPEDFGYDAVASFDWVDWSLPFPDSVNFGISYGKKNAPFWRIFRETMRILHNDLHGFTGVMNPYKLLEKYPQLLRISRHLAVICYQQRCHPTWVKDYHNMDNDHVTSNSIPNWREDVNVFHWTHPNPPEYANQTALLNSNTLFAEIGKNVLKKAKII